MHEQPEQDGAFPRPQLRINFISLGVSYELAVDLEFRVMPQVGPTGWECLSSVEILDFTTMLWTSGAGVSAAEHSRASDTGRQESRRAGAGMMRQRRRQDTERWHGAEKAGTGAVLLSSVSLAIFQPLADARSIALREAEHSATRRHACPQTAPSAPA